MHNNIALYTVLLEQEQKLNKQRRKLEVDFVPDDMPEGKLPLARLVNLIKR